MSVEGIERLLSSKREEVVLRGIDEAAALGGALFHRRLSGLAKHGSTTTIRDRASAAVQLLDRAARAYDCSSGVNHDECFDVSVPASDAGPPSRAFLPANESGRLRDHLPMRRVSTQGSRRAKDELAHLLERQRELSGEIHIVGPDAESTDTE